MGSTPTSSTIFKLKNGDFSPFLPHKVRASDFCVLYCAIICQNRLFRMNAGSRIKKRMQKLRGTLRRKNAKGSFYYRLTVANGVRKEFALKTTDEPTFKPLIDSSKYKTAKYLRSCHILDITVCPTIRQRMNIPIIKNNPIVFLFGC